MDNKEKLDLYLNIHDQASSTINNLQTGLFTTIAAVIASGIFGILLGLKDFGEVLPKILYSPMVLVIVVAFWCIGLFFVSITTFICIVCVSFGFRMLQIEKEIIQISSKLGEIENMVSNEEANIFHFVSTVFYYPGLLASGYCHRFFPPLLLLTVIAASGITIFNYYAISFSNLSLSTLSLYNVYLFITSHNILISIISWLVFLFISLIVVPIFTPNSRRVANWVKETEILIITETLSHFHGTEVAVFGFAKHARNKMNRNVAIVGPVELGGDIIRKECEKYNIPIVQLPSFRTWFLGQPDYRLAAPLSLRFLINPKTKVVFINAFPGPLGFVGLLIGKLRKKKIAFYYHVYLPKFVESIPLVGKTKIVKYIFRYLTRIFSNSCDVVFVPSNAIVKEMLKCGVKQTKILTVPTGVDEYFVTPPSKDEIMSAKAEIPSPVILYVGRLSQEKNLDLLIYSFIKIHEIYPSATLVLAGRGPEEKRIKALAKMNNIDKYVVFKGYLNWNKLKPLYWAADVFCMTSLGESQGLSILEAKASCRPCVVLNKVGAGEQIINEVDGLLVDEGETFKKTVEAYACAILRVLSDKVFASKLGDTARNNALKRSIEISTEELIAYIDKA